MLKLQIPRKQSKRHPAGSFARSRSPRFSELGGGGCVNCILGIDLGTSSVKSIVITEDGAVRGLSTRAYQFSSPRNGYAEQDPRQWWDACCETVREVLVRSGVSGREICGVSFSGQMHGVVLLDENFEAVRPAILHCDARSGAQVEELNALLGRERIRRIIMNPIYTGFLLPSLLWVKEQEPENFRRVAHVMLPKDYLKFRMTGEVSTDVSDASATLAFDIRANSWSREVMDAAGLPFEWLPPCLPTTAPAGTVHRQGAEETGLAEGTVVVAGGADQVIQGVGNGTVRAGDACVNIGTSGQVSFQSDSPVENPALNTNTFCGYRQDRWYTMGAIMNAGLSYSWYSGLFPSVDHGDMNERIAACPPGSGGLIFLPYLNGERTPHLNPNISGVFAGLTPNTGRVEMARAVMEGVCYALNQCVELCEGLGLRAERMIASGGGARSLAWLQIQSDVFGLPLIVADTEEQAGLGAAIVAGVGTGLYRDVEEGCGRVVRYKNLVVEPDPARHRLYQQYYGLFKELYTESRDALEKITLLGRSEDGSAQAERRRNGR